MNRSTFVKIIIPLLLALAVALGLIQRGSDPFLKKQTFINPLYQNASADRSLRGYYEQGQVLAQTVQASSTVTFVAAGDIMLSRNVAAAIAKSGDVNLPFRKMARVLKSTDFNFANLESPISGNKGIVGGHTMVFGSPSANVQGLKDFNFQVLNLANNHAFDQGLLGLTSTKSMLENLGIKTEGTGKNLDQAWQPVVMEANGIKTCFLGASYASVNDSGKTKNNYVARIEDLDRLKSSILNLKSACDFIVASMHAGIEYTRSPNQAQIDFAHAAIDDGADIVIGAHPHWVQTIELYQGKYIFYSLGNFIFDQMFSQDTKEGLALKITISKSKTPNPVAAAAATMDDLQGPRIPAKLDSIELLPVIIENYSTPRPATAQESKKILEKIGQMENILK